MLEPFVALDASAQAELVRRGDAQPIGIQIVADYGREDLLIQVAAQLEEALPWMPRWLQMVETL